MAVRSGGGVIEVLAGCIPALQRAPRRSHDRAALRRAYRGGRLGRTGPVAGAVCGALVPQWGVRFPQTFLSWPGRHRPDSRRRAAPSIVAQRRGCDLQRRLCEPGSSVGGMLPGSFSRRHRLRQADAGGGAGPGLSPGSSHRIGDSSRYRRGHWRQPLPPDPLFLPLGRSPAQELSRSSTPRPGAAAPGRREVGHSGGV
jgi:hypothetical protein